MLSATDGDINLVGHLGRAPVFEKLTGGSELLILELSTRGSRRPGGPAGCPAARLAWHRVVSFAPGVIRLARDLHEGDAVAVTGQFSRREYMQDGQRKEVWEIVADRIILLRRSSLSGSEMPLNSAKPALEEP